jgi:hypothetical protein
VFTTTSEQVEVLAWNKMVNSQLDSDNQAERGDAAGSLYN